MKPKIVQIHYILTSYNFTLRITAGDSPQIFAHIWHLSTGSECEQQNRPLEGARLSAWKKISKQSQHEIASSVAALTCHLPVDSDLQNFITDLSRFKGSHTNSSQMSSSGEAGKASGTGSDASGCACASIALAAETRAFALAEIAPTPCNLSHFQLRVDIQTSQKSGQRRAGTKKHDHASECLVSRVFG